MTDKQIIIDGVDVSGCDELHINKANTIICEITGYLCDDRQNCYYKQLLRKEQECEELKNELIDVKWKIEAQDIELNDKEEQLDQLKTELEQEKNWHKISDEISKANSEYTAKLKQTLTEIKEIANKFDYWNSNLSQTSETLHEIIEKINEVEDE